MTHPKKILYLKIPRVDKDIYARFIKSFRQYYRIWAAVVGGEYIYSDARKY